MFLEFAFTPSVFDESENPDTEAWLDQLLLLGAHMFPKLASSPVMIANLHGGSWYALVREHAESIDNHKAKMRCREILKKSSDVLVVRPANQEWPVDDISWGREAILSSRRLEPIERIVGTLQTRDRLAAEGHAIRSLDEVEDAGFWHGLTSSAPLPATIEGQVTALHKLCVHSEFLCLIAPYIFGDPKKDETNFARQLIQSAFDRPQVLAPVEIEIHTMTKVPPDDHESLKKLASGISLRLQEVLLPGQQVKLRIWPLADDKDRHLVAGVHCRDSTGRTLRRPLWGIAMTHLAFEGESTKFSHFSQMSRAELGLWHETYCREGVRGYSIAGTISQAGFKEESRL